MSLTPQPHSQDPSHFWDKVAQHASTTGSELGKVAQATVDHTLPFLRPTDRVLDIGCGTGDISIVLGPHAADLHGIDTSQMMIAKANQKVESIDGPVPNFECISPHDEQMEVGSYDVALAFNVLHYLGDLRTDLGRVNALLKPGGLFISSTACVREKWSLLRLLLRLSMAFGWVPRMTYFKKDGLASIIEENGFEIIERHDLSKLPDHFIVAKKRNGS